MARSCRSGGRGPAGPGCRVGAGRRRQSVTARGGRGGRAGPRGRGARAAGGAARTHAGQRCANAAVHTFSRLAFEVWLLASLLITSRAIAIGAGVFIVLGGIQIVATTLIMLYAARYKDAPCPSHLPRPPGAKTATRTGSSGNEPGSWRPVGHRVAESAALAEHGGAPRAGSPVVHPRCCTLAAQAGQAQARTKFHITHWKERT
jgi:hypothetical protein